MYYGAQKAVATQGALGKGVGQIAPHKGLWNQLTDWCNPLIGKGFDQVGSILK